MQSKASLWALSYVALGWILFRFLVNLPALSTAPTSQLGDQFAQVDRLQNGVSVIKTQASKSLDSAAKLPEQTLATAKMDRSLQLVNPKLQPLYRHEIARGVSSAGPARATQPREILPVYLGTEGIAHKSQTATFDRVSVSGWLLVRPQGSSQKIATAGQLGGSQIGARAGTELASIDKSLNLNGFIRVSSALIPVEAGEAAIGVSVRHTGRLVSELLVERRIKLSKGGRSDFALVGSTSVYDLPITSQLSLEGYAQAGIVGLRRRDMFVDASVRANQSLLNSNGSEFSAGAGIWAAAQPGAHRIDVGPQITFKRRLGTGAFRISGEWRFRLEGNARPNSGAALTAGFDF